VTVQQIGRESAELQVTTCQDLDTARADQAAGS
jgi:hypothetical protein